MRIIDVAGLKDSGKTTVIENIVEELSARDYKVGTLKKIHIPGFTIDHEGKDTYRHMQAGATFVISVAPQEIAFIQHQKKRKQLEDMIELIPNDTDFLICEELNEARDDITYIITLKKIDMLAETLNVRSIGKKVMAICGIVSNSTTKHADYNIINTTTKTGIAKLVGLILDDE